MDLAVLQRLAQQYGTYTTKVHEELKSQTFEGHSAKNQIKVVVGGDREIDRVYIDAKAVNPDKPVLLEGFLRMAINDAQQKYNTELTTRMQGVVEKLGLDPTAFGF